MSTQAQIRANQANAQKSTGPTSEAGKEASSGNRRTFGLSSESYSRFLFVSDEREEEFFELLANLICEHAPHAETEKILVHRMAEHEWLRARAVRLQDSCCTQDGKIADPKSFALYLRYQTTHERAFYRALNELQKLRNEKRKQEIGFESQKRLEAGAQRAAEALNLKKQEFELKKARFAAHKIHPAAPPEVAQPAPAAESNPAGLEMAA